MMETLVFYSVFAAFVFAVCAAVAAGIALRAEARARDERDAEPEPAHGWEPTDNVVTLPHLGKVKS